MVCTPRHLSALVRGPVILDEGLFESLRHLVLDEVSLAVFCLLTLADLFYSKRCDLPTC